MDEDNYELIEALVGDLAEKYLADGLSDRCTPNSKEIAKAVREASELNVDDDNMIQTYRRHERVIGFAIYQLLKEYKIIKIATRREWWVNLRQSLI